MDNGIRWNRRDGKTNARCRCNAFASQRKQIAGRGRLIKNVNNVSHKKSASPPPAVACLMRADQLRAAGIITECGGRLLG